jgi:hypothetical protein
MGSGKLYARNYIIQGGEQAILVGPLSPKHSKEKHVPNTMKQEKTTRSNTSRQRRDKQTSPKIVAIDFVPVDTLIKESHEAKKSKNRKGRDVPRIPSKPNRRTRLTNQLRLNYKALFNPSLKYQQPIVIEDEGTKEDISRFENMEEMDIHH